MALCAGMPETLSRAEARRIAIAAQGLAAPRPARVDTRALRAMMDSLGVVQIDSVNVLVRSHYLPAWSRLGAYDTAALDTLAHRAPRTVFEYWGHEASLLPVSLHPLLRWRMARAHQWRHVRRIAKRKQFVADVLAVVAERGPIGAGDIELGKRAARKGWWEWSDAKIAVEWLFWSGQITSAARRGFERLYDITDRVLPAKVIAAPTPSEADAIRALIDRAGRALGIATERDLRDYFRLRPATARPAIGELVEAGVLRAVTVDGIAAYLHRDAETDVAIERERAALLTPFDSLVWCRERTERLFGMRFRLELYTPQHKRVHGYYVLPFLLGDALVARIDLKADRAAGVLRVQASHLEPGAPRATAAALARELRAMADWLELERVAVEPKGDLAAALANALVRKR
jgi:uncharacterized protein